MNYVRCMNLSPTLRKGNRYAGHFEQPMTSNSDMSDKMGQVCFHRLKLHVLNKEGYILNWKGSSSSTRFCIKILLLWPESMEKECQWQCDNVWNTRMWVFCPKLCFPCFQSLRFHKSVLAVILNLVLKAQTSSQDDTMPIKQFLSCTRYCFPYFHQEKERENYNEPSV